MIVFNKEEQTNLSPKDYPISEVIYRKSSFPPYAVLNQTKILIPLTIDRDTKYLTFLCLGRGKGRKGRWAELFALYCAECLTYLVAANIYTEGEKKKSGWQISARPELVKKV